MDELLLAKIMPPQRGGMLDRPRIADRIAGTDGCKVAFLTAPAGYGKTVAMLQAAKAMDRKLAWCQLDVYDNDPVYFCVIWQQAWSRRWPVSAPRCCPCLAAEQRAGSGCLLPLLSGNCHGMKWFRSWWLWMITM